MYWSIYGFGDGVATCGRGMLLPVLRDVRRADALNAVRAVRCATVCGCAVRGSTVCGVRLCDVCCVCPGFDPWEATCTVHASGTMQAGAPNTASGSLPKRSSSRTCRYQRACVLVRSLESYLHSPRDRNNAGWCPQHRLWLTPQEIK